MFMFSVANVALLAELLSEQILGNTSLDDTSMKFTPYVPFMTRSKTIPGHLKFGHFQDGHQKTKWPAHLTRMYVVN